MVGQEAGTGRIFGLEIFLVPRSVAFPLILVMRLGVVVHAGCTKMCRLLAAFVCLKDGLQFFAGLVRSSDGQEFHLYCVAKI